MFVGDRPQTVPSFKCVDPGYLRVCLWRALAAPAVWQGVMVLELGASRLRRVNSILCSVTDTKSHEIRGSTVRKRMKTHWFMTRQLSCDSALGGCLRRRFISYSYKKTGGFSVCDCMRVRRSRGLLGGICFLCTDAPCIR